MMKLYMATITILLLIGCGPENKPNVKSAMFQSVSSQEATLVKSGKDKASCSRCGMNLVMFYKTSHVAQHKDKPQQYCSIHCLQDHLGEGVTLKNPQVVDADSLKLIHVGDASYVVGSKKRGTMTRVSKYAFLDEKMAEKFQEKFGGKIMNFNEALEVAKKDFKR
ncbi:nitrous oxide reductase accessory protein NosL [Sulfurimonas sp.]|uniref:nitrous oxide reductase accessory protein NosL n=1 Tax=Sulfurimonas sp. TaxID=2022749 RepID=UPI0025FE6A6E|nr:nitrous oxide reductase accessory protein NosL [Sulfurimonas sp.]